MQRMPEPIKELLTELKDIVATEEEDCHDEKRSARRAIRIIRGLYKDNVKLPMEESTVDSFAA